MKKSSIPWLFAVIGLSVLLAISVYLGLSGYYFSTAFLHSKSDVVVGNSVVIKVLPNQSNVVSFTFDGAYLPDEKISQVVQIEASDLNADVAVRVKAVVFGGEQEGGFEFVTTEHFEEADDGYYYFDDVLKGGNKMTFCNYLKVPKEANFVGNEKYVLSLVVETLESRFDVGEIWKKVQ